MQNVKKWLIEHELISLLILVFAFFIIRLPGLDFPLHQDEYKWPMIVNPANQDVGSIPHPPLSQFIYRTAGYIVGFNTNFRYVPLFFGTINLLLLYYLVRTIFNRKVAVISSLIWIFSYFSVLASLMVDTDGEVMPFFFLLALIGYFKLKENSDKKYYWAGLLIVSVIFGFLVKISFLLAAAAIGADFLWSKRKIISREEYVRYGAYTLGIVISLGLILFLTTYIFPFFSLSGSLKYWEHFAVGNRNWLQTAIQLVKAILYSSPLLVITPLFMNKDELEKNRIFIFFLGFSLIFYILLFDFSIGALDRYLQLFILPLSVMSATVISRIEFKSDKRSREFLLLGIIISLIFVVLQSVPHYVPPLHPKTEWINRIISFKWNFLYPFSGGSGPLGFYVSFLFIGLCWISTIGLFTFSKLKKEYARVALIMIIPISLAYNAVFIEEYLFGIWNGSAVKLTQSAVSYIKNHSEINKVIVYNDNGGNEIRELGKYERRLYAVPGFESTYEPIFKTFDGYILYVDIPRIMKDSIYEKYMKSCTEVYVERDKYVNSRILKCGK